MSDRPDAAVRTEAEMNTGAKSIQPAPVDSTAPSVPRVSGAQIRAAHAYAATLLEPELAGPAADDAITAFNQALATHGEIEGGPQSVGANETLLALTRLMTAVTVPDVSSPADRRLAVWASIGSASHCTCRESAALLATRANGNIQPRESAALNDHLAGCAHCVELSAKVEAAEVAFRRELVPPRSGGFGLGSLGSLGSLGALSRSAYSLVALVVAVGVGVVALSTGGSHNAPRAAVIPVQTQASSTFVAAHTVTATGTPVAHTTPKRAAHTATHPLHPHPKTHPAAVHHARTVTHQSQDSVAASSSADQGASDAAASTPPPVTQPATAASQPSSASVVSSGQSSLPADTAPQQGIGTLTTSGG